MPQIRLDLGDAAELAEMLTFLADWLSGTQKQALRQSLAAFVGHPAYDLDALHADLHRFVFLLGVSDGEELFGEPYRLPAPEGDGREPRRRISLHARRRSQALPRAPRLLPHPLPPVPLQPSRPPRATRPRPTPPVLLASLPGRRAPPAHTMSNRAKSIPTQRPADTMINNTSPARTALDRITRITPILWSDLEASMTSIWCR